MRIFATAFSFLLVASVGIRLVKRRRSYRDEGASEETAVELEEKAVRTDADAVRQSITNEAVSASEDAMEESDDREYPCCPRVSTADVQGASEHTRSSFTAAPLDHVERMCRDGLQPWSAAIDSSLINADADGLILRGIDAMASVDYSSPAKVEQTQKTTAEHFWDGAGEVAKTWAGGINPFFGVFFGIFVSLFAQNNDNTKAILEHVEEMIEQKFDAFRMEQLVTKFRTLLSDTRCAHTKGEWERIEHALSVAEIFNVECEMNTEARLCKDYQKENGGNKMMFELFFVDMMAVIHHEAARNGWSTLQHSVAEKLNTSVRLLRAHVTIWRAWRVKDSQFVQGTHYTWKPRSWRSSWRECWKLQGKDLASGGRIGNYTTPGCPVRCWPWYDRDAFTALQGQCFANYKKQVKAQIDNRIVDHIAKLENLSDKIDEQLGVYGTS